MSSEPAPWRRQSSQISGGGGSPGPGPTAEGDGAAVNAAPPLPGPGVPPPPPPPGTGIIPVMRLNTEIPDTRGKGVPPAAIQNAMMTKDKKPFTYTPGGIDLSEIRSPRMQRRISRNAKAEGVSNEPKVSPLAQQTPSQPLPPSALAAMQPQVAIPVFPQGPPPQLNHVAPPPPPPPSGPAQPNYPAPPPQPSYSAPPTQPSYSAPPPQPSQVAPPPHHRPTPKPVSEPKPTSPQPSKFTPRAPEQPRVQSPTVVKVVSQPPRPESVAPSRQQFQNEPGSIYVPPVAKSQPAHAQLGSIYIPPINQTPEQPPSPINASLNKVTTPPWMNSQNRTQPQSPPYLQQLPPSPVWSPQRPGTRNAPPLQREDQQQQTRIIPIQVEGRDSPTSRPQGQPQQRTIPVHMGRDSPSSPVSPGATRGGPQTRIIPIQMEGQTQQQQQQQQQQQYYQQQQQQYLQQQQLLQQQQQQQYYQQQQQQQQRQPIYAHNKFSSQPSPPYSPTSPQDGNMVAGMDNMSLADQRQLQQQLSSGPGGAPIQSRSFRVLQKITDTDATDNGSSAPGRPPSDHDEMHFTGLNQKNQVPSRTFQQLRKMQLTEDDRALMNKFKSQVDEDSSLHTESDPRYRGAAIPSRAFRMLQTMTDSGDDTDPEVPRGPPGRGPQQYPQPATAATDAQPQPYVHPSEQQVLEPKKYTGGAIPSRSFKMLQAMTAPENYGPGQSDM